MRTAGAANAFPYAPDHAAYINAAKRETLGIDHGWLVSAESPDVYAPVPGDLICYGRDQAASLRYVDLPAAGSFPAHCDIVVEPAKAGAIGVIGGNVADTVTMRHIPVMADGRLAAPGGVALDQRRNWLAIPCECMTRSPGPETTNGPLCSRGERPKRMTARFPSRLADIK